ncbi:MAG TPA: TlpA disulfide reductase family protein [Prolixibacteraceae bacterium]|nr:TlpA disulfide reductase family protein [Prolixibacteraceae bacterium]
MKPKVAILLISVVLFSCSKSAQVEIKGTITNSMSKMIYLEKLEVEGTTPFDSSRIDSRGNFRMKGIIHEPTFFLLKLNDRKFITLLLDSAEKVTFSADFLNFANDYTVSGSYGSQKVKELNQQLLKTNTRIDSIRSVLNLNAGSSNFEEKKERLLSEMNNVYRQQQNFSKKFILENPFSMASILAIYQKFNDGNYIIQDLQTIKVAASALHSMYPNSEHVKTLYEDTKKMMKQSVNSEFQELVKNQGINSPEINLPNPEGRRIPLSSLRGNYVLIQFWSCYDPNSRMMNPVLKENYQKFHSKGFEIYQVCIDTSRQAWLKVMDTDQMNWINVGDMKGSINALNSYNITTIPSNYLLDKDGAIIAKDLIGPSLYRKLSEILN